MTVDYERATSEERLDEVQILIVCMCTKHNPNLPVLMQTEINVAEFTENSRETLKILFFYFSLP